MPKSQVVALLALTGVGSSAKLLSGRAMLSMMLFSLSVQKAMSRLSPSGLILAREVAHRPSCFMNRRPGREIQRHRLLQHQHAVRDEIQVQVTIFNRERLRIVDQHVNTVLSTFIEGRRRDDLCGQAKLHLAAVGRQCGVHLAQARPA